MKLITLYRSLSLAAVSPAESVHPLNLPGETAADARRHPTRRRLACWRWVTGDDRWQKEPCYQSGGLRPAEPHFSPCLLVIDALIEDRGGSRKKRDPITET